MSVEAPRLQPKQEHRAPAAPTGKHRWLIGGVAALAVLAALLVWLLVRGGDDGSRATRAPAAGVSLGQLNAVASGIPHPVYWAGTQSASTYELTRTGDGRVYIRYLPRGTKVGTPRGDYLTIGTYPQANAFATLAATAKKQGVPTIKLAGGGLAFQDAQRPTSVYAAYPSSDYQIEVFEPSATRALKLVKAGKVAPLVKPASAAASVAQLKTLGTRLGHPVYWAGPQAKATYELTRTKGDRVFVRYLAPGARVGDSSPKYVTVGTYPQTNALAALKATAAKTKARTFKVAGGGTAYVDRTHPTSTYIAYPGKDVQVELYAPDAKQAQKLIAEGKIAPVR
jgi:hypothetical protein